LEVSLLVSRMDKESSGGEETTRKQLRDKIASLSQPQVKRAADALILIWNCAAGPPAPFAIPTTQSGFSFSITADRFPNWDKMKLAFLKAITTGVFIDVQFYAYNKICDNSPVDPKPLYASSIVIEEWAPAITTRESEGSFEFLPV
jgi:hypothetical protein